MRARSVEHPPSIPPPTRAELMRSIQSDRLHREGRQTIRFRTDVMERQMADGRSPRAELVADSPLAIVQGMPRRGDGPEHASYRVRYLRGGVLVAHLLVPRRGGPARLALRVRHPGGSVERLPPIEVRGPITEARVALRLRPGTTVVEIAGGGRIDLHWDGTSRLDR